MPKPMAGHPSDFDLEDQQILREEAEKLRAQRGWTKTELGLRIGIAQQNASRFLKGDGGIRRRTANRLALELGFRDAEGLIAEGRFMRGLKSTAGSVWSQRDSGVRMAEALGYSKAAVTAVVERAKGQEFAAKSARWWLEQIMLEELGRRAG